MNLNTAKMFYCCQYNKVKIILLSVILLFSYGLTNTSIEAKEIKSFPNKYQGKMSSLATEIMNKAKETTIDELKFKGTPLSQAIKLISEKSGMRISAWTNSGDDSLPITLNAKRISVFDAVNIISLMIKSRLEFNDDGIDIYTDIFHLETEWRKEWYEKEAKGIKIKKLYFENATVDEVLDALEKESGIYICHLGIPKDIPTMTFSATSISFLDALEIVMRITNLEYRFSSDGIDVIGYLWENDPIGAIKTAENTDFVGGEIGIIKKVEEDDTSDYRMTVMVDFGGGLAMPIHATKVVVYNKDKIRVKNMNFIKRIKNLKVNQVVKFKMVDHGCDCRHFSDFRIQTNENKRRRK